MRVGVCGCFMGGMKLRVRKGDVGGNQLVNIYEKKNSVGFMLKTRNKQLCITKGIDARDSPKTLIKHHLMKTM